MSPYLITACALVALGLVALFVVRMERTAYALFFLSSVAGLANAAVNGASWWGWILDALFAGILLGFLVGNWRVEVVHDSAEVSE
jgi:ABC-type multidrug transport system permease subunit